MSTRRFPQKASSTPHRPRVVRRPARVSFGAEGCWLGQTARNPSRPSDRSLLIRFIGGTACEKLEPPKTVGAEIPAATSSGLLTSVEYRWLASLVGNPRVHTCH